MRSAGGHNVRDHRSGSFWDRTFLVGLAVSLLWHFFWFFSIRVVVSTPKKTEKPRPYLVSLGPVMDDAIFKTLVEAKPEFSKSFYRRPTDFSAAVDLPALPASRYEAGSVVSVPFGRKFVNSLKEIVGGIKTSPDFEWTQGVPLLPVPGESEEERKRRLGLT